MRVYMGFRLAGSCHVYVWDASQPQRPRRLDPRTHLRSPTPVTFDWGYSGSGPTQLALALCADALGDGNRALAVYHGVDRLLLGMMPRDLWSLTADQVCQLVHAAEDAAMSPEQRDLAPPQQKGGEAP
jgi:hypothetical protein